MFMARREGRRVARLLPRVQVNDETCQARSPFTRWCTYASPSSLGQANKRIVIAPKDGCRTDLLSKIQCFYVTIRPAKVT
jgi:hypothetical protein